MQGFFVLLFRKSDCKDFRNSEDGWLRFRVWNAIKPQKFPHCTCLALFTVRGHMMQPRETMVVNIDHYIFLFLQNKNK